MLVKNKKDFFIAVLCTVLALVCAVVCILDFEVRFLLSSVLFTIMAMVYFVSTFSKKGILEELSKQADERDLYLVMKSSQFAIKIVNYTLCFFTFLFILLYGIFKYSLFIILAGTLCSVVMFMFVVFLCVNIYMEKHA